MGDYLIWAKVKVTFKRKFHHDQYSGSFFFINLFNYLCIFGCVGSSFLCEGFRQLR